MVSSYSSSNPKRAHPGEVTVANARTQMVGPIEKNFLNMMNSFLSVGEFRIETDPNKYARFDPTRRTGSQVFILWISSMV